MVALFQNTTDLLETSLGHVQLDVEYAVLLVEAVLLAQGLWQAKLELNQWERRRCSAKAEDETEKYAQDLKTVKKTVAENTELCW